MRLFRICQAGINKPEAFYDLSLLDSLHLSLYWDRRYMSCGGGSEHWYWSLVRSVLWEFCAQMLGFVRCMD